MGSEMCIRDSHRRVRRKRQCKWHNGSIHGRQSHPGPLFSSYACDGEVNFATCNNPNRVRLPLHLQHVRCIRMRAGGCRKHGMLCCSHAYSHPFSTCSSGLSEGLDTFSHCLLPLLFTSSCISSWHVHVAFCDRRFTHCGNETCDFVPVSYTHLTLPTIYSV